MRVRHRHSWDLGHRNRLRGRGSRGEGLPYGRALQLDAIGKTLPWTQHVLLADRTQQRRLHLAFTSAVGEGEDGAVLLVTTEIRALVDGLLQHTGFPCLDEIPVVSVSYTLFSIYRQGQPSDGTGDAYRLDRRWKRQTCHSSP